MVVVCCNQQPHCQMPLNSTHWSFNITPHFLLSWYVCIHLFYWDSNRVASRCYFITVLYFNYNSSGQFELEWLLIIVYDIFVNTVHFKDHLSESAMVLCLWPGSWIPKDEDHPVLGRRLYNRHRKKWTAKLPKSLCLASSPTRTSFPLFLLSLSHPPSEKPREGLCYDVLNKGV